MSYPTESQLIELERSALNVELELTNPLIGALCDRVRARGLVVQHIGNMTVYVHPAGLGLNPNNIHITEFDLTVDADILALDKFTA